MLVSHDRHFLKEVTDRTIMVQDGNIQIFEGGYEEFLKSEQGDTRAR